MSNSAWMAASFHRSVDAEEKDFYSTDPAAVLALLKFQDKLDDKLFSGTIWEPACGDGAISKVLSEYGFDVVSSDLYDRGYGQHGVDFLNAKALPFHGTEKSVHQTSYDIITNPPYKQAIDFVAHSLDILPNGHSVAMLLRIGFLEGYKRYQAIYRARPPKFILVFVRRIKCYKNGVDDGISSAVCYAWFIWQKNENGEFDNTTSLYWI